MRTSTRALCLLLLGASLTCGCVDQGGDQLEDQDPKAPGEVLGFFTLAGKLSEDTCGKDNLHAPDQWSFDVKLSRDGSALYWLNGREGIVGEINKAGEFSFETHIDLPITPKHGAVKGCTIVRRDLATGTLADSNAALSVKLTYAYEAAAASDCSELITLAVEGMPEALPCRMSYSLKGSRLAE